MKYFNFSEVAEVDRLRSEYMFENIFRKENLGINSSDSYDDIPRHLIQYWDDEIIPEDVKKVMETWTKSGLQKTIFNKQSAGKFISENFDDSFSEAYERCNHPAMRADYFRLCYLYKNGGFYVDVDDKFNGVCLNFLFENNNLKVAPLCYDLSADQMVDIDQFYYNTEKANSNYVYYVNNDPILAPAKHQLIDLTLNRATYNLLNKATSLKQIQSVAGPGNLSACVVQFFLDNENTTNSLSFELIENWDKISTPQWDLMYRRDQRNWRIWSGENM